MFHVRDLGTQLVARSWRRWFRCASLDTVEASAKLETDDGCDLGPHAVLGTRVE